MTCTTTRALLLMALIGSGCSEGTGDVTSCYCGDHLLDCDQPGAPNGPCVQEITAAAGRNVTTMTTDAPSEAYVLARYGDPNDALGRAANIHGIAGAFCPTACGF